MKLIYKPLFQPFRFPSGLEISNRIIMAPMTTWSSYPNGRIHEGELPYLDRRSKGPGLVMTACAYVIPHGHAFAGQWGAHTDEMIPSLASAAKVIMRNGAKAILQIHHGGRMCPSSVSGIQPLSASAIAALQGNIEVPRAMTEDEIWETIHAYGDATRRAIEAGFDGVEIHGANTYLLQQFFSPHSNHRNDDWGGTLEKRMRFPMAVVASVQAAARKAERTFAVGYRISPEEIEEPGITIDDTLAFIDVLTTQHLDWIHVSTRDYFKGSLRDKADAKRPTKRIIDRVNGHIPLIGVGKIIAPDDALFVLQDGCDAVALARVLLTEPEWVEKVRNGEETKIRKAIPKENAQFERTLPEGLYRRIMSVKGWVPVEI